MEERLGNCFGEEFASQEGKLKPLFGREQKAALEASGEPWETDQARGKIQVGNI